MSDDLRWRAERFKQFLTYIGLCPEDNVRCKCHDMARAAVREQHVCGLSGYNPMIDPPCPGPGHLAPEPAARTEEPTYPCAKCGVLRTKAEGGTTFTVCDDCWESSGLRFDDPRPAPPSSGPAPEWCQCCKRPAYLKGGGIKCEDCVALQHQVACVSVSEEPSSGPHQTLARIASGTEPVPCDYCAKPRRWIVHGFGGNEMDRIEYLCDEHYSKPRQARAALEEK